MIITIRAEKHHYLLFSQREGVGVTCSQGKHNVFVHFHVVGFLAFKTPGRGRTRERKERERDRVVEKTKTLK